MKSILPIVEQLPKPDLDSAKGGVLADFWHVIIGDRVAAWRLKNAAKQSEILEKELSERGVAINPEKLPERFVYSWFEKATEEDEPELQTLWAKLMAHAAEGNEEALNRRNIDLLSRMSPEDARLLEIVSKVFPEYEGEFDHSGKGIDLTREKRPFLEAIENQFGFTSFMSVQSLISLGILRESLRVFGSNHVVARERVRTGQSRETVRLPALDISRAVVSRESYHVTLLGRSLIRAVFPLNEKPEEKRQESVRATRKDIL